MRVAVLGLGRMGRALAGRLLDSGHELSVWNRSGGRAAELVAAGAREEGTLAAAVDGAGVVLTILSNDGAVREVALGKAGLGSCLGGALYVDCSTVSPGLSNELGVRFGRYLAMPILGNPDDARAGRARYLLGGSAPLQAELQPLLDCLTWRVSHYDQPGKAACAKLATNLLLLSEVAALAEVFAVGRSGGLSDAAMRELFDQSALMPPGLANRFEAVLTGDGPGWWTTSLGAKDAGLAVDVAEANGIDLGVARAVRDAYLAAARVVEAGGHPEGDISAVRALYNRRGTG